MNKKRLIVIDGHALVHRAYHALPPLRTKKGELVNAVYGFFLIFLKAIKELNPDFVVATFDLAAPTFRHKKFPKYKITRPKAPKEIYQQIPKVKEILKEFKIPIFEKQGFEADDLIGTIAKEAKRKQVLPEIETIILSGDLDALQLVDKNTKVYTLRRGLKETILYDEKAVKERFELAPVQLLDFKALKGDPSDNIPGVPGIGEKTAIELLKEFGTLENIYQAVESDTEKIKPRFRKILQEHKDIAQFSKVLAEIKTNVALEFNLRDCAWQKYDRDKIIKIFQDLGFYTLLDRLPLSGREQVLKIEEKGIEQEIEELYSEGIFSKKIYEIEKSLVPVVKKMEESGVKIDLKSLKELSQKLEKKILALEKQIFQLAGVRFNLNSPKQLSEVLFLKLKIPTKGLKKTPSGVVSTAWPELKKLRREHPIIDLIAQHRVLSKLKSGFVEPLPNFVAEDGRLHPKFHQLGTETGRFSCSAPNLQNVPIKGELGQAIRKCFVAEKGFKLVSADYSQMELRVAAHLADDKKLLDFFRKGKDIHKIIAAQLFKVPEEKVTEKTRALAKTLNFGVLYGMSSQGFAERTGVSLREAKKFISDYFQNFKGISKFARECVKKAQEKGFSETMFGRKRLLAGIKSSDLRIRSAAERMAKNMVSQGSSADIIKMAMIEIDKTLRPYGNEAKMILQIHDELLFEIKSEKALEIAKEIKKIMENVVKLKAPLKVEVKAGNNWAELNFLI